MHIMRGLQPHGLGASVHCVSMALTRVSGFTMHMLTQGFQYTRGFQHMDRGVCSVVDRTDARRHVLLGMTWSYKVKDVFEHAVTWTGIKYKTRLSVRRHIQRMNTSTQITAPDAPLTSTASV